jgi:hypothetical protein
MRVITPEDARLIFAKWSDEGAGVLAQREMEKRRSPLV